MDNSEYSHEVKDEQAERFRKYRLNGLRFSNDLKHKTLENFEIFYESQQQTIYDLSVYVRMIIGGRFRKGNLFLLGPTGTGKSHLAVGILKLLNDKLNLSMTMGFISSYKMAQEEMNSWKNQGVYATDICEEYAKLDFLVIDDFGFNDDGQKMKIIQKILFMRHEGGVPTIITSNLLQEECLELMGDRVRSRFMGNLYKSIVIKGIDYRLKDQF